MQMKHRLSRVRSNVGHEAIAVLQTARVGNFARCAQTVRGSQQRVFIFNGVCRFNMNVWDYQNVRRRAGVNIIERGNLFILKNNIGGRAAGGDFAKDT